MAKKCLQCDTKIGFFKKAIEGGYCSETCADKARVEMEEQQKKADALRDEAKREAAERAERERVEQEKADKADKLLRTCPKCEKPWEYTAASDGQSAQAGSCSACNFSTEFARIEKCPHCRSMSLVVAPDDSVRCPRCKYKKGTAKKS